MNYLPVVLLLPCVFFVYKSIQRAEEIDKHKYIQDSWKDVANQIIKISTKE